MMKRIAGTVGAALVAVTMLATLVATPAMAKPGDVIRSGACSGASHWKLKLSPDNGRIEVQFEVDQNVNGQLWRVGIRHNGDLVFSGRRVTQAPSGSFEVRILQRNRTGNDLFVARAANVATGETCVGRAVFTA